MADADAEANDLIRVIDESGEDYVYPARLFKRLTLPGEVQRALRLASYAGLVARQKNLSAIPMPLRTVITGRCHPVRSTGCIVGGFLIPGGSTAVLCGPPDRNKADLDSLMQGARDPAQYSQGVAFIVGILKAADDRRCGANEPGKLSLSEARGGPQFVDLAGDLIVRSRLLEIPQPGRLACIESAVKDLNCVDGGFRLPGHVKSPGKCAWPDSLQTLLALHGAFDLLRRDHPSFTRPCDTTAAIAPWKSTGSGNGLPEG